MWWNRNDPDTKLERRVRDLEATVSRLETESKNLRMEWEKTFEQVMNALRRLGKRARDAVNDGPAPAEPARELSPALVSLMQRREAKMSRRRVNGGLP